MRFTASRLSSVLAVAALAAACGSDSTAPQGANPVHGVLISVEVPGQCLVGGCDPPGQDRTHLALATVTNTGTSTAYLHACGTQVAYREQVLVNGAWQEANPTVDCGPTPGLIAIAPGASVQSNWFFATGRRRIVVGVSGTAAGTDEALDTSAAFTVS